MSQHHFDYVIIGSGLAGLSIAARLSQETQNILLLEGGEHYGGWNRPVQFPNGTINNGLRFLRDDEPTHKALGFLEDLLGLKLIGEGEVVPPVTYAEGHLKEFLGFGDQTPEFYDQLAPFTDAHRLTVKLQPYAWTELLWQKFAGTFWPKSFATKIVVENGRATQVVVNGGKPVTAENVIYCGSVKQLATLLPSDILGARAKQKLSKTTYWTGLCVDLAHGAHITDSHAIHILNGTTVDELGPCVGRFLPEQNTSQWMTFIDEDITEDTEAVGHALKKIKRQLKRAYPTALDGLVRERIVVTPMLAGTGDLKVTSDQKLSTLDNLYMGSSAIAEIPGVAGALTQAHRVLNAMGFETKATIASANIAETESETSTITEDESPLEAQP